MPSSTGSTVAAAYNAAKPPLEDFGPVVQLVRAGPCGSSPTVPTVPLARRHRHQYETFTVWLLHSWACPTAAGRRAQGGEAAVNRRKMGVFAHRFTHLPEQVKTLLPTNVATAERTRGVFVRNKEVFVPNSRARRRQLRQMFAGAVKTLSVTENVAGSIHEPQGPSANLHALNGKLVDRGRRFIVRAACRGLHTYRYRE